MYTQYNAVKRDYKIERRETGGETEIQREKERVIPGMILFEAKRMWMTEGLNSILDTRARLLLKP